MKNENKGIITMAAIAAIVVILVLMLVPIGTVEGRTVEATGFSDVSSEPDEGVINFRIEVTANTSEEAGVLHGEKSEAVNRELLSLGIRTEDMIVTDYRLYEEYVWKSSGRRSVGFKATSYLEVRTSRIHRMGKFIDGGISAGALVSSIYYEVDDTSDMKIQALEQASADAKNKAAALLRGIGEELGELVSISTSYDYHPYPIYRKGGTMMDIDMEEITSATELDLYPEDVEVSATVYVIYKIK